VTGPQRHIHCASARTNIRRAGARGPVCSEQRADPRRRGPDFTVIGAVQTFAMRPPVPADDPVRRVWCWTLDEAFRVLEALEDARLAMRELRAAPGLQDELATVIAPPR